MDLSVVVPTYGRREALALTLEAYERQTPDDLRFELVVVDDGSSDGTAEWLASRRPKRYRLRFDCQENAGPAAARNRALARAEGEIVLITGDDIEPTPDLLHRHVEAHRHHADPKVAVLGLTIWPPGERLTATMRHIDGPGAQQFSYGNFTPGAEYDFRHLYTSNISLHRSLLAAEPGPFSTIFPSAAFEDAELGHRLAFHGLRIVYHPEAVGHHHHPYGVRGFYRRQVRCGQMAVVLLGRHPELVRWLGVRELEWRRLDLLALPAAERRRLRHAIDDPIDGFDAWRERALALAEHYDPIDPPGVDELLRAVFDLGYQEGLATALWGAAGRTVITAHAAERLPDAVRAFEERATASTPCGLADARALAAIRPFLASGATSR
ncbi:MAG: glycosyltransferase [Acidobacteriota bacterium]